MKKNKLIPLVALVVVLGVLIASYTLLLDYNKNKAAKDAQKEEESTGFYVTSMISADVNGIYYLSDKHEMTLALQDSAWIIPDDAKFPVNQTVVTKMVSGVVALTSTRVVDEGELSDYGLDEPKLTIKMSCVGGKTHELLLGDVNSYNESSYLLYNNTIYMVKDTFSSLFDYDKESLIKVSDAFPGELDSTTVASAVISGVDAISNTITDADGLEDFVTEAIKYINFKSWSGYGLTNDELNGYGIGEDSPTVTFEYNVATASGSETVATASYTVVFGEGSDGACYYTTPGSNMTYSIAKKDYDVLMSYVYYAPAETAETAE